MDEVDLAFEWLERAYVARDTAMASSACNPLTLSLHGDPRWATLMNAPPSSTSKTRRSERRLGPGSICFVTPTRIADVAG